MASSQPENVPPKPDNMENQWADSLKKLIEFNKTQPSAYGLFPESINPTKYDFRIKARENIKLKLMYPKLDEDQSGTYDPSLPKAPVRKRTLNALPPALSARSKKLKPNTWEQKRMTSGVLTESEELRYIKPHTPDPHSEPSDSEPRGRRALPSSLIDPQNIIGWDFGPTRKSKRIAKNASHSNNLPDSSPTPLGKLSATKGSPHTARKLSLANSGVPSRDAFWAEEGARNLEMLSTPRPLNMPNAAALAPGASFSLTRSLTKSYKQQKSVYCGSESAGNINQPTSSFTPPKSFSANKSASTLTGNNDPTRMGALDLGRDSDASNTFSNAATFSFVPLKPFLGSNPFRAPPSSLSLPDSRAENPILSQTIPFEGGCWGCAELKVNCSLLDPAATFPCWNCKADAIRCEAMPFDKKSPACDQCRQKKVKCSFRETALLPLSACDNCVKADRSCTLQNRTYDKKISTKNYKTDIWENAVKEDKALCTDTPESPVKSSPIIPGAKQRFQPTAERRYAKCGPCREEKKSCSLSNNHAKKGPCGRCSKGGISCYFEPGPQVVSSDAKDALKQAFDRYYKTVANDTDPNSQLNAGSSKIKSNWKPIKIQPCPLKASTPILPPNSETSGSQSPNLAFEPQPLRDLRTPPPLHEAFTDLFAPLPSYDTLNKGLITTPTRFPYTKSATPVADTLERPSFIIWTPFSHPMLFNNRLGDCHWCQDVTFGLIGLETLHVEVQDLGASMGYFEVAGGHGERGVEQTKMCQQCVNIRLSIITCDSHIFQQISAEITLGQNEITAAYKQAYDSLAASADGLIGENIKHPSEIAWCSICLSPAFFYCDCGFKICEKCYYGLHNCSTKTLQDFLTEVTNGVATSSPSYRHYDQGLRSDVELLKLDGELLRRTFAAHSASR
ncbi:MAG: hypothetical protein M1829_001455 [Trizodia sp. TS-e1964]|nr:MAG: hypothetical protein M1829_001455 [Trizodia sp. TS-e1964]